MSLRISDVMDNSILKIKTSYKNSHKSLIDVCCFDVHFHQILELQPVRTKCVPVHKKKNYL